MNYKITQAWLVLSLCTVMSPAVSDVATTLYLPHQKTSITLLPEIGFGDQVMYPLSPKLQTTIENSDSLLVETETGTSQTRAEIQHAILTSQPNQLRPAIKKNTWDQLQDWINKKAGHPGVHLITSLPPHWALVLITNTNLKNKVGLSITQHLITQEKQPTAIMNAQEQLEWYTQFSNAAIDSLISQSIHENTELYDTIATAWKKNDLTTLKRITQTITNNEAGQQIQQNYDKLNATITDRLKLLPPGNHVAAINIVSYLGENNVIDQLLAGGYQIKDK